MLLVMASCKTVEKTTVQNTTADVLLTYSKSRCLGKCPVYNVKILKDGMLVYTGVDWVRQKGNVIVKLSDDELAELKHIINTATKAPPAFKRIRDRPVTALMMNEKKYKFHGTPVDDQLKTLNSRIEHWVDEVNTK